MKSKRIFCLVIAVMMLASCVFTFVACKDDKDKDKKYYNNDTDILVFSTAEVDRVFNPFFSTSGTDSNIVGMTQIGMIANDENGNPAYGEDEAVVVLDMDINTVGVKDVDQTTTYQFVLKNNVKFSNGSPLTIKDVLFNLYVYLDPMYTGSSTIYSTDIVGLKEYRTQERDPNEQDAYELQFRSNARTRITSLIEVAGDLLKDDSSLTIAEMTTALEAAQSDVYPHLVEDFAKTQELFKEELGQDYSNSLDSYQDQLFTSKKQGEEGKIYEDLFTTDVEMFLYNEGLINWVAKEAKLSYDIDEELVNQWKAIDKEAAKQAAIDYVYQVKMPGSIEEILLYWATSANLLDYITKAEMEAAKPSEDQMEFRNIEGIKFANFDKAVTVNGNSYDVPQYNSDGSVKDGYNEVLSITIKNVDPKAIWNFAFAVAPMYYYSDKEHIDAFDYANDHFGVEYKSQTFMQNVVKDPEKIGVPVGAGPYAASKSSGGFENVKSGDFYDKGVIYFEGNPHYIMGAPKIKHVRYQVVSSNAMLDSLYTGFIDYAAPNAKPETRQELIGKANEGLAQKLVKTLGYGYIGVNAGKIPNVYVRRAIMYAMDTSMCVKYYKNLAAPIYRSMSTENWAYPEGCLPYYPFIGGAVPAEPDAMATLVAENKMDNDYYQFVLEKGKKAGDKFSEAEQQEFLTRLMSKAKYTLDANGIYSDNGKYKCEFEFTIAGEETDHPAYDAMLRASEILNKIGFNIKVKADKDALKKLSTGSLYVWAAAWGSTIDPDMYQVYHKDSTASSVLNWGYKQILADQTRYPYEYDIICGENKLSDLIDEARTISYADVEQEHRERAEIYSRALDYVMELAVELPTYQRNDLFAYNSLKLDQDSLYSPATSFKGLTSNIHTVSLVVEK